MTDSFPLRIGTRGSPLALAQAHDVRDRLIAADPVLAGDGMLAIEIIKTTGDMVLDRPLADVGGKGLFSKEIDEALLDGRVDLAVHSLKDLETWMPDGIALTCVLEREDPRDVFISDKAASLDDLPAGSVVGTSSLRRQAQILRRRPDLKVETFRGNVQTRMRKLADGEADATLLALAGLRRLGMTEVATEILDPDVLLPAVAQGAVGVTCRAGDAGIAARLEALKHETTWRRVSAERAMLAALDGSCRTPIGGLAEIAADGTMTLRGLVAKADGSEIFETTRTGAVEDAGEAEALGRDAGEDLRRQAGPGFPV
ncbi:MAG: hydroxymethylbilane synthase [Rhodospirillales bacterium]|nr:hydroxymethylbilane synthase [Alphaproteobacteria bacterium]MBL6948699.1 hydroxymethylbilane synthase [Rhodospirillales bacterium]